MRDMCPGGPPPRHGCPRGCGAPAAPAQLTYRYVGPPLPLWHLPRGLACGEGAQMAYGQALHHHCHLHSWSTPGKWEPVTPFLACKAKALGQSDSSPLPADGAGAEVWAPASLAPKPVCSFPLAEQQGDWRTRPLSRPPFPPRSPDQTRVGGEGLHSPWRWACSRRQFICDATRVSAAALRACVPPQKQRVQFSEIRAVMRSAKPLSVYGSLGSLALHT